MLKLYELVENLYMKVPFEIINENDDILIDSDDGWWDVTNAIIDGDSDYSFKDVSCINFDGNCIVITIKG